MYKFIRRISSSFLSRPDRPWNEDATSTAPQIGQKRRLSSSDDDDVPAPSSSKRHKADPADGQGGPEGDALAQSQSTQKRREGEGVKEVTKGVQDVELKEKKVSGEPVASAAAVPLPDSPVIEAQSEPADPKAVADESAKAEDDSHLSSLEGAETSGEAQKSEDEARLLLAAEEVEDTATPSQAGADALSLTEEAKDIEESPVPEHIEPVVSEKKNTTSTQPAETVETIVNV